MLQRSINAFSISKHSGALISSRLIPPNVSAILATVLIKSSVVRCFTSISIESRPAKRLNSSAFPSITGFEANGPKLPRPNIAVPFVITATMLPLPVYLYALAGSAAISRTGSATPGLYAKARS